jgi:hypothetical protein
MKKFIAFMLAALIGVAASSAQVVESRIGGVYIEKGPAPEHRWFAKLGAGLALQNVNDTPDAYGGSTSSTAKGAALDLSLGYNRDFRYSSSWYWGGKVGVALNLLWQHYDAGSRYYFPNQYERIDYSYDAQSVGYVTGNLHIGPTIGFRKPVGNGMKLDINFTPEFFFAWRDAYNYGFKIKTTRTWESKEPETIDSHSSSSVYCESKIAASATLGVDLWINNFIVGVNYRCATDFNTYFSDFPQTIMFNVGLAF